jgi:hypothetical protein
MSRKPTAEEIRETNPNITKKCDRCNITMNANKDYATFENSLTLSMTGGYGEFVDSAFINPKELEFMLCHKCGHKLMKEFFSQWVFSNWHPRTKDKYCDGWIYNKEGEYYA